MNTETIIDQLNAYTGDNIWQDVILHLDGYDETATEALDPSGGGDRFALTGDTVTMIRYDRQTEQWHAVTVDDWRHDNDALRDSPYNVIGPRSDWNSSGKWRVVKQELINARLWSAGGGDVEYLAEADTEAAAQDLLLQMSKDALSGEDGKI